MSRSTCSVTSAMRRGDDEGRPARSEARLGTVALLDDRNAPLDHPVTDIIDLGQRDIASVLTRLVTGADTSPERHLWNLFRGVLRSTVTAHDATWDAATSRRPSGRRRLGR